MPKLLKTWKNLPSWMVALLLLVPIAIHAQEVDTSDMDEGEEYEELEAYTMVGSRIKQIDQVTIAPVVNLSRGDMEATGFTTVGEAIRSLSFNSGGSLSTDSGGSTFGFGASTVNFRGVGNNNVLMLVNGRRAAPYGSPSYDGYQTVFNLDSLPASAIESVNILKDGGSAIYGSDAVSGVIDIQLRRDFEGVNTQMRYGDYTGDMSAAEKSVSLMVGTSTANTSIVVSADYTTRSQVFARELDWQGNTADIRSYADRVGLQAWQDWAYGVGGAPDDYFYNGYGDQRSTYPYPARVSVPGEGSFTFAGPTNNPTIENAVPYDGDQHGRYDYAQNYDYLPSEEVTGFYTSVKHDFSESLYGFIELAYRKANIHTESAPAPMVATDQGDGPLGAIMIPAANPYNPWDVDITSFRYRAVEAGNRASDIEITTPRVLLGMGGEFLNDWTWEVGLLSTESSVNKVGFNIFDDRLQQAFNGVLLADYDTDEARMMYLNPFGPSDPEINDYISGPNPNDNYNRVGALDASASGPIFELPAGDVQLAIGGEYRKESYAEIVTDSNRSGNIVGGSWYDSSDGSRNVTSVYAEMSLPIFEWAEAQVAVRREDYSDFGDTTKPKIAVKIRPLESLLIRASYGESFLAPNLAYLYTSEKVTFTSSNYLDPLREGPSKQMEQHGGGNPELLPEETQTYYLGAKWEPSGVLDGFYVEAEYFFFDSENLISDVDAADMLNNLSNALYYTERGNIIRRAPAAGEEYGEIVYLNTFYENLGDRDYKGFDFTLGYRFETQNFGEFNVSLAGTILDTYTVDDTDYVDYEDRPEYVANATVNWNYGDWAATMFVNYTGERKGELTEDDEPEVNGFNVYDSQIITNLTASYGAFFGSRVSIGVTNLFDEEPPLSFWGSYFTTPGTVYTKPRFWYLSIEKEW